MMAEQAADILHILRSAPYEGTRNLMSGLSTEGNTHMLKLYEGEIDWEGVVDAIFNHTRVVCWW